MLWLKAWLETRWRLAWTAVIGLIFFAMPLISAGTRPSPSASQIHLAMQLLLITQAAFLAPIMLAGSGVHTASTRVSGSDKGADRSILFTLSLPVTRIRLFLVRTAAGLLETGIFLAILFTALWILWLQPTTSPHDAFAYFAVVASGSLTVYAVSACLSTFWDEGARIRASVLIFIVPEAVIFRTGATPIRNLFTSMLTMHRPPWLAIGAECILALLFFAAAMAIIQRRDY